MMWKYFYAKGTYNWVDALDGLTENYNSTKHGSILMKPKDVNKTNENLVWVTLYGLPFGKLPLQKFRVGDTVRVSRYKSIFGYHEGEPIIGKFYEEELSAVNKKGNMYRVEKVLRKKNGMALVKWLGYDSRSWVPIEDIKRIE